MLEGLPRTRGRSDIALAGVEYLRAYRRLEVGER